MNWETLLCLGDSITIGARTYLGYPEYAADQLKSRTGRHWNGINLAVSGITAVQLHRLISEQTPALSAQHPELVTVLIGTNDVKLDTPPELFRIAYEQVLLKARLICRQTLVLKLPALQAGVKLPYEIEMNARIRHFNELIVGIADDFRLPVLEFEFTNAHFFDGVHLNEAGVAAAGRQLADYVLARRGLYPMPVLSNGASCPPELVQP